MSLTLNNKGQSTIEFVMSMSFSIGMLFLFLSLGINYGKGFFIHYVTFMTSRSYLTYDNHTIGPGSTGGVDNQASEFAREAVFDKFPMSKLGFPGTLNFTRPVAHKYLYVGAYYEFSTKLSYISFIGAQEPINLTSESFLGRTPTRGDCGINICRAISSLDGQLNCISANTFMTLFDNGC